MWSPTVDRRNPANHQGCIQPCNGINMVKLFKLPINWCRISAINSSTILQIFLVDLWSLGRRSLTSGVDAVFVCRNGGLDVCFTSGVHFNSFHGTFSRLLWYGMVFSERLRCIHRKVERCGTFWMRGFLVWWLLWSCVLFWIVPCESFGLWQVTEVIVAGFKTWSTWDCNNTSTVFT